MKLYNKTEFSLDEEVNFYTENWLPKHAIVIKKAQDYLNNVNLSAKAEHAVMESCY